MARRITDVLCDEVMHQSCGLYSREQNRICLLSFAALFAVFKIVGLPLALCNSIDKIRREFRRLRVRGGNYQSYLMPIAP
jgi:hypothetical protein